MERWNHTFTRTQSHRDTLSQGNLLISGVNHALMSTATHTHTSIFHTRTQSYTNRVCEVNHSRSTYSRKNHQHIIPEARLIGLYMRGLLRTRTRTCRNHYATDVYVGWMGADNSTASKVSALCSVYVRKHACICA